ncbi:DUF4145 domain-containing protein [Priestia megaterium]|uniref:DUF4145 domain-containing protein n=1 Tax=Priestia megaterium TaxID=1404 RepID=UPI000BF362CB|nr:DUF4145 domain-containing protein [Priestia megaterium]MCM3152244.1 DUF4145 domain-containing protein [Priestia megaterium]PFW52831.1 hypothetical protein COL17_01640 [Priestia megaterium]
MSKTKLPVYEETDFNCPRCGVLTEHEWFPIHSIHDKNKKVTLSLNSNMGKAVTYAPLGSIDFTAKRDWHLTLSICQYCEQYTIWENRNIIYPFETELPSAHEDMPNAVKDIYLEAQQVFKHSPRAAAALLRLAIEILIPLLEDYQIKKAKINTMIGDLVKKGIPDHIQQGLDAIRIYGNEGIHPGDIRLNENTETVMYMFELTNEMVEELITRKKKIRKFYSQIPANKTEGIANRDKATKK